MKIELTSYLGLDYTSQDQYSLDLGLKMANREEATREDASSVGTDNVVSEVVNQPAAYPVAQTEYYTVPTGSSVGSTGSVVGEVRGEGGGWVQPVVPPVPPVPPVPTPVQPVVPPVTPVVSTQQSVLVPCCPTSWMGTHTHQAQQSSERGEGGVMRSSSRVSEFTGEKVTVCGETGVLVNVNEIKSFTGPLPLTDYPINQDTSPEVVRKQADPAFIEYTQDVCLKLYFKRNFLY